MKLQILFFLLFACFVSTAQTIDEYLESTKGLQLNHDRLIQNYGEPDQIILFEKVISNGYADPKNPGKAIPLPKSNAFMYVYGDLQNKKTTVLQNKVGKSKIWDPVKGGERVDQIGFKLVDYSYTRPICRGGAECMGRWYELYNSDKAIVLNNLSAPVEKFNVLIEDLSEGLLYEVMYLIEAFGQHGIEPKIIKD